MDDRPSLTLRTLSCAVASNKGLPSFRVHPLTLSTLSPGATPPDSHDPGDRSHLIDWQPYFADRVFVMGAGRRPNLVRRSGCGMMKWAQHRVQIQGPPDVLRFFLSFFRSCFHPIPDDRRSTSGIARREAWMARGGPSIGRSVAPCLKYERASELPPSNSLSAPKLITERQAGRKADSTENTSLRGRSSHVDFVAGP